MITITDLALVSALLIILLSVITIFFIIREGRSRRLRRKFGRAEYARAINESGNRRHAEARLEARSNRLERQDPGVPSLKTD